MAKTDIIPHQDSILDEWEGNFATKLAVHGPTLGIAAGDVTDTATLIATHRASYSSALTKQAEAKAANDLKNANRADVVAKVRDIAQKCKASSAYTKAIGSELGIEAAERTLNLNEVKPIISNIAYQIDQIVFDWVKGHMDGIVIYGAKRTMDYSDVIVLQTAGSGQNNENPAASIYMQNIEWEEINRDYRSPYEDKRKNVANKPEARLYRMQYLYKDQLVGQLSDIVKVIAEIY